ncbi:uncharacterized protein V6R79_012565 [Siganus canaliculatus]
MSAETQTSLRQAADIVDQRLKSQDDDTNLTKKVKVSIPEYLNEKYADPFTEDLFDIGSLLDPRFNITYINPEKIDDRKTKAAAEMDSLEAEQEKSAEGDSVPAEAATESSTIPIFQSSIAPIFQSSIAPIFQSSNVPSSRSQKSSCPSLQKFRGPRFQWSTGTTGNALKLR